MSRPASPSTPAVVVQREPYGSEGVRWVVARAEDELITRYGMLDEGELGLTADMFDPPTGAYLVARADASPDPVGGAGVRTKALGTGEVRRVWVDPAWRRRGVARVLMEGLEHAALELGLTDLLLATGDRQPEAVALYESLGWERVKVVVYDGPVPVEVYRFVKSLG